MSLDDCPFDLVDPCPKPKRPRKPRPAPVVADPLPPNTCDECGRHLSECHHPRGESFRKGGTVSAPRAVSAERIRLQKELERARAENAALKARASSRPARNSAPTVDAPIAPTRAIVEPAASDPRLPSNTAAHLRLEPPKRAPTKSGQWTPASAQAQRTRAYQACPCRLCALALNPPQTFEEAERFGLPTSGALERLRVAQDSLTSDAPAPEEERARLSSIAVLPSEEPDASEPAETTDGAVKTCLCLDHENCATCHERHERFNREGQLWKAPDETASIPASIPSLSSFGVVGAPVRLALVPPSIEIVDAHAEIQACRVPKTRQLKRRPANVAGVPCDAKITLREFFEFLRASAHAWKRRGDRAHADRLVTYRRKISQATPDLVRRRRIAGVPCEDRLTLSELWEFLGTSARAWRQAGDVPSADQLIEFRTLLFSGPEGIAS